MTVGLVGGGPALAAIRAALADVSVDTADVTPDSIGDVSVMVVVDDPGGDLLVAVNERARDEGTPWVGVELGGVGGHGIPSVAASVAGFGGDAVCYGCLRGRVSATDPDEESPSPPDRPTQRFAGAIAGRATAQLVAADERTILGSVIEVPHASRRFLPLPGCSCGANRDWEFAVSTGTSSRPDAIDRAETALDPRVGLVTEVGEAESFPAPYYLATVCDTSGFSDATAAGQAAGVAVDWNTAFLKALGEALERYSAGVYRTATLPAGSPSEIAGAVDPTAFVGAESVQDRETDHAWVPGRDLHESESIALPASVVFFPPPDPLVRPPATTGLALGSSTVEAVLAGLYETIERDAAMLAWYSSYEPLELVVSDDAYETLVRRARSADLEATAILLTQDVDIPVIGAAVHRREGDWPRFAAGMGASLDPGEAARSALAEALQNWMELRGMGPDDASDVAGTVGEYATFPPAAQAFVDAETEIPVDSVGPAEVPSGRSELDVVLARLADGELAAYAARLTPPDVASLGFEAVRCLVPAAQPLITGEPVFGERARSVPQTLGFEPRLDRSHHPFP